MPKTSKSKLLLKRKLASNSPASRATKKRVRKSLERFAREIKDSDEFVAHIAGICERYRREHTLSVNSRGGEIRRAVRTFHKLAMALGQWLDQAHQENRSTVEAAALNQIGIGLHGGAGLMRAESKSYRGWLALAEKAAATCAVARPAPKNSGEASRIAAEGLLATFEHHHLKLLTAGTREKPSAAVRLLCEIATSAGDSALTPERAKKALADAKAPRKNPAG